MKKLHFIVICLFYSINAISHQVPHTDEVMRLAQTFVVAEEAELVYFVDNYPTGITILKADQNGVFQPLHFVASTSSTGVNIYFSQPCN